MAEPKSGAKTTEMWVTVVAGVFTALNSALHWGVDEKTIMAIAFLVVTYTIGRSAVKLTNRKP